MNISIEASDVALAYRNNYKEQEHNFLGLKEKAIYEITKRRFGNFFLGTSRKKALEILAALENGEHSDELSYTLNFKIFRTYVCKKPDIELLIKANLLDEIKDNPIEIDMDEALYVRKWTKNENNS